MHEKPICMATWLLFTARVTLAWEHFLVPPGGTTYGKFAIQAAQSADSNVTFGFICLTPATRTKKSLHDAATQGRSQEF